MNSQNTQHLLEQISVISKKYKDIAKITGENFNIFQTLSLSTAEVKLHSKLISELLNPKGSHDQEDLFLKLFIDECKLNEYLDDVDLTETIPLIEVGVGKIDENYESGGRIDIVLKFNNGKSVLIENKINAYDQRNQLLRYQKAFSNSKIVYLNLWGDSENIKEIGGLDKSEFIWISYRDNVTRWLTKSLKEIYNKPNIVYILEHYLNTVKTITNQNTNSNMNKELINSILQSEGNISAAFEISNVLYEVRKQIAQKLIDQIQTKIFTALSKEFELKLIEDNASGKQEDWAGYKLFIETIPFNLFIYFSNDYDNLLVGLKAENSDKQEDDSLNKTINSKITVNSSSKTRQYKYAWMQEDEFIYNQLDPNSIYEIHNEISITRLTDIFNSVLSSVKS
jgi:hypothetical protein